MTELAEMSRCQCGLPMQVTARGASFCENCDSVQVQELIGLPRSPTREDIRFQMYWIRMEEEYEDNTTSKGDETNE